MPIIKETETRVVGKGLIENMNPKADVLIITVTEVESRAVIEVFREATGKATIPVPIGDRMYHDLGEIKETRVFMALSEMGSGGLGASQQTVQKGIAALHPAAVIMLGIAFGINEHKQAIGDILVSRQLWLYELQRVGKDQIIPRGDKPHSSLWLFNRLKGAALYWDCDGPKVSDGLILTGEKLMDNVDFREQLKQFEPEAVGGEMEGAGLYVACQDSKVDWILVKAICDWADGTKGGPDKDAHQATAANNAARFVLHALQLASLKLESKIVSQEILFATPEEEPGKMDHPGLSPISDTFAPLPAHHVYPPQLPSMIHRQLCGRETDLALLDAAWKDPRLNVISMVAAGGVGKTALVQQWLFQMQADNFRGAERFYGVSFYSQGSRGEGEATADPFIAHALEWFGDPEPTKGSPWDRGARLAELINQRRTLLILDGLEPLQYRPDTLGNVGKLKDQALAGLLTGLAYANQGLCLITTRFPVRDLEHFDQTNRDGVQVGPVRSHGLDHLSNKAGVELLAGLGVQGLQAEMEQAASEFKGHALALSLLGTYLKIAKQGDIRKRGEIEVLKEKKYGGHAQRMMAAYAEWFTGKPALDILFLIGLFNRPVAEDVLTILKDSPLIPGLTEKFQGLSEDGCRYALADLRQALLLDPEDESHADTLDCHPLIRQYFGDRLKQENLEAWREAHNRLYEYYKTQAPEFPDTLEAMLPLYAAVSHGCHAGRHLEALVEVYIKRICKDKQFFSFRTLGAFGSDLSILSGFFDSLWQRPLTVLREDYRGFVLSQASYCLRALGRLSEAAQVLQAGLESRISSKSWTNASIGAENLCTLSLVIGKLTQAEDYARQAIVFAKNSPDKFREVGSLASRAVVLLEQGRLIKAKTFFQQAVKIQQKSQPFHFLYSLQGFYYCGLLLSLNEYEDVLELADKMLSGAIHRRSPRDIGLGNLSLGEAYLMQAFAEGNDDFSKATSHLDKAVTNLRQAGDEPYIVQGLLTRAGLYRVLKDWPHAHKNLQESMARANRSGMALHQADAHLEYARLYLAQENKEKAQENFNIGKKMVTDIGYYRRRQDILVLEAQLRLIH